MTQDASSGLPCPVCGAPLALRLAHGRRSGKPFVMLVCATDGRHFRGFIGDQGFVSTFLARLEAQADMNIERPGKGLFGDNLERLTEQ